MQQTRSNPYSWNPIFWLAYGCCLLPVWLVQFLVKPFVRQLRVAYSFLNAQSEEKQDEPAQVVKAATDVVNAKPQEDDKTVQWECPVVPVSEIGRVELTHGYVVFRYLAGEGTVKGKMTVTETTKSKRRKKPISAVLEAKCSSRSEAERIMKKKGEEEVSSLLAQKKEKSIKPRSIKSEAVREDEIDGSGGLEIPKHLLADDLEMQMGRQEEPDPFDHFSTVASEVAPAPTDSFAAKPPTAEVTYKGVLLAFGRGTRKLDDPVKGERTVNHYGVRIFDEKLQADHPLWGNDLKRVIQESGAQVGDRVELGLIGETEVLIKGKPTKKKVWSMTKL